ncbi:MAG: GntR family transcriptional regulator [Treponema sp.]|nr:GntR family transcriptional regulator [Treponema sp.]
MSKSESSVQSAVYNALKNNIMTLQMKPGTVMSTQEVAKKLDVSRTPVREAFIQLQRDGLVNIFPQKETIVSRIDLSKVEQERFIRESLECANLELVVEKFTRKDISELELNIERQHSTISACDYNSLLTLDNEFHHYLFKITEQKLAWEMISSTSNHYSRIRLITVWNKDIMMETILQHQKILSAIQEKDAEYAKITVKAHLHQLENQIGKLIQEYPDYFVSESLSKEERFSALLRK